MVIGGDLLKHHTHDDLHRAAIFGQARIACTVARNRPVLDGHSGAKTREQCARRHRLGAAGDVGDQLYLQSLNIGPADELRSPTLPLRAAIAGFFAGSPDEMVQCDGRECTTTSRIALVRFRRYWLKNQVDDVPLRFYAHYLASKASRSAATSVLTRNEAN